MGAVGAQQCSGEAALGRRLAPGCAQWQEAPCLARDMGGQAWQHPGCSWRPGDEAVADSPQNGMALGTVEQCWLCHSWGTQHTRAPRGAWWVLCIHGSGKQRGFLAGQEEGQEARNNVSKITGWF